jgi:hypothetical protein
MKRQLALLTAATAIAALCSTIPANASIGAAPHRASGYRWGTAEQVPGMAELNGGAAAVVYALSCAAPGYCGAAGSYNSSLLPDNTHAFAVSEAHGRWDTTLEVPGEAALNAGGHAYVNAMSCPTRNSCSAGGSYTDRSGHFQTMVFSEVNGTWRKAQEIPGSGSLNTGGAASVNSLSCGAAGDCSAGGDYTARGRHLEAFVATQKGGKWGRAQEVPGTASLNAGDRAQVSSVSCPSAGNCSAGGEYTDRAHHTEAFVVGEQRGRWGAARQVPGIATLGTKGSAVNTVSCASAGNCSAGGYYLDRRSHSQAFVVAEHNGVWGKAQELPGTAPLNAGGSANVSTMSCAAPGDCSLGGTYQNKAGQIELFVATEKKGRWGKAEELPGSAALNPDGNSALASISCAAPGDCTAGGMALGAGQAWQAVVASERNGRWRQALLAPGTQELSSGVGAAVTVVSCTAPGVCEAGGWYVNSAHQTWPFVISES